MKKLQLPFLCLLLIVGLGTSTKSQRRFIRRVSSKEEAVDSADTALVVASESGWEKLIAPAPQIVYLLGSLMVVSTVANADFSLERARPEGGFEYIKSPKSFQATLIQVSNECYGAFSLAHKNMDKIFLYMGQIESNLETALKILDRANTRIIQNLFPIPIESIFEVSKLSAKAASETEDKFNMTMRLIGEVIRSVGTVKPLAEQDKRNVEQTLNRTQFVVSRMKEREVVLKKRMDRLEGDVKRYQREYDKYMDEIPTGWNAVLLGFGHAVTGLLDKVGDVALSMVGGDTGGGGQDGSGGNAIMGGEQIEGLADRALVDGITMGFGETMERIFTKLTKIFKDKVFAATDDPIKAFKSFKNSFNANIQQIRESGGTRIEITKEPLQILSDGAALCDDVIVAFSDPDLFPSNKTIADITAEMSRLIKLCKPYGLPEPARKPSGASAGGSASTAGSPGDPFYNERYKASQALTLLMHAQDRSDKFFTEYNAFEDKMTTLMVQIKSLDYSRINYQKIIEIMRQGMDVLTQIQQEWSKLVEFFQMISNRANLVSEVVLAPFIKFTRKLASMTNITRQEKMNFLWILVGEAMKVEKVSLFLRTVAGTYVDISQKYIIRELAGLPRLLSAKPQERKKLIADLETKSREGQVYIKGLAEKHKAEFQKMLDGRIKAMTAKLDHYVSQSKLDNVESDI